CADDAELIVRYSGERFAIADRAGARVAELRDTALVGDAPAGAPAAEPVAAFDTNEGDGR
ncbi:hypothetical protein, partial [Burkholderia multivorans]